MQHTHRWRYEISFCHLPHVKFREEMDEELRHISDTEALWVGGDFNGHCGRNNSGKEETIGKYGGGETNEAGTNDNVVAFAMGHNRMQG